MNARPSASPDPDEKNDPVWKLLDHARPLSAPPRFTADVMRALRAEHAATARRPAWWRALFSPALRPAWAAAVLAGIAGSLWLARPSGQSLIAQPSAPPAAPVEASEDVLGFIEADLAMLDEIDSLLTPQDAHELSDADVALLLF